MQRHRVVRLAPQGKVREGRTDADPARTDNARSRVGRGNGALAAMLPGPPAPHCFAFSGVNPKQQNKTKHTRNRQQQARLPQSDQLLLLPALSLCSFSCRSHFADCRFAQYCVFRNSDELLMLPALSALSHAAPNLPLAACWPLHLRTAGKPDAQGTTPAVREAFFHFQLPDSSFRRALHSTPVRC